MKNTLIDAGPLIALFNKNDKYHEKIKELIKNYKGLLTTSWPVITETCHMLDFNVGAQIDFLKWIRLGGLKIEDIQTGEIDKIIKLSEKYSDIPMDLADATLVIISERLGIKEIITIDSDYYIYRTTEREMLRNIFNIKK
ncbi:MAG: PIN domain-containing protein [Actinobacteria bacterium]|nr:PIN domain-containing protein [Actinomycetota bacterium]